MKTVIDCVKLYKDVKNNNYDQSDLLLQFPFPDAIGINRMGIILIHTANRTRNGVRHNLFFMEDSQMQNSLNKSV